MRLAERRQTDESLRVERASADREVTEKLSAIDETADAVIKHARDLADELLAGARTTADQSSTAVRLPTAHPGTLAMQRLIEDETLRTERAEADETLRRERAAHVARHSVERVDTDKDLSSERARSDSELARRDEFLGVVSHDLRNMLNGIMGFAEIIEGEAEENHAKQIVMHAQRIRRSGARMNRLIGDLVDIASIDAGELAVTRVNGDAAVVVKEAVETFQPLAAGRGVSLELDLVTPPLLANFDPARILQVLINLLSNALKFTPSEGNVALRVERIKEELLFSFSDTGVGIPADMLDAVFERFLQVTANDRRGVGLGLYISKCIVQGHGGRIWATSKLGEGSTFCFTLPIEPAVQ